MNNRKMMRLLQKSSKLDFKYAVMRYNRIIGWSQSSIAARPCSLGNLMQKFSIKKVFLHEALIIILFMAVMILNGCRESAVSRYNKANQLYDNYQFEEALAQYKELEKDYPDFHSGTDTISLVIGMCYEALGDYPNAFDEYKKADRIYDKLDGFFKDKLRFTLHTAVFTRIYIKTYKVDKADYNLDYYFNNIYSKDNLFNNSIIKAFLLPINSRLFIDNIMINLIDFRDKDVVHDSDLREAVSFQLGEYYSMNLSGDVLRNKDEHTATSYLERDIFDLLSYKTIDNKFYSDQIWDMDVTRKYFDIYFEKGLLNKSTLEKMRKYVKARDKLPDNFVKLFDNPKCR